MAFDGNTVDRLIATVSVVGGLILSFLAGSATTEFEVFPYPQLLERGYEAFRAQKKQFLRHNYFDPKKSDQWIPVEDRMRQPGVVKHDPEKVHEGYTLFSVGGVTASWLIDHDGEVKHEWYLPWEEAFRDNHPHVDDPAPPRSIKMAGFHVYPNGDLLAMYTASAVTPYGYGLVRMDKNSEPIWAFPDHTHHSVDIQPDGKIWTLTHEFRDLADKPLDGYRKDTERVLEDFAVLLSEKGEELKRLSLNEAIARSEWKDELHHEWIGSSSWDLLHANSIEVIRENFAEHHDFAEAGQLLISLRSSHALVLVDVEAEEVVWATQGFWRAQHAPEPHADGSMSIFDNKGYSGPGGASRIAQFDPGSGEIQWSYSGTREQTFDSPWGGKMTTLQNGNVLISETKAGRLLEVTRDREVVWQFNNPLRLSTGKRNYTSVMTGVHERIDPNLLEFTPQGTIGESPIWEKIEPKYKEPESADAGN